MEGAAWEERGDHVGGDHRMDKERERKLREAGFSIGNYDDFLELSAEEKVLVELRLALVRALRQRRKTELKISQTVFAKRIGSSQSRVARIEAGDPSVSLDLIVRSLVQTGSTSADIGRVLISG